MSRSNTLCLFIAYISAIGYTFLTLYSLYALIAVSLILDDSGKRHKDTDDFNVIAAASGVVVTVTVIDLIKSIAMLVASIYLIMGINKDQHQYMAPWVYMTIVSVILTLLGLLGLMRSKSASGASIVFVLVVLGIQVVMWYPIFSLYRQLRYPRRHQQPLPSRLSLTTGYNSYPSTPNRKGSAASYSSGAYAAQKQLGVYNPRTQMPYLTVTSVNCNPAPAAYYTQRTMESPSNKSAQGVLPEKH